MSRRWHYEAGYEPSPKGAVSQSRVREGTGKWKMENGKNDTINVLGNVLENKIQLTDRQNNILKRLKETSLLEEDTDVTINDANVTINNDIDVTINVIENNEETAETLSAFFGVSVRTIRRDLIFLQENGFIRHIGPNKGGRWQVFKQ